MASGKRLYAKVAPTTKLFNGIASPTRGAILDLLLAGPQSATQLSQKLKIPQNLLAHHINAMTKSEWLLRRKVGRFVLYRLNPLAMRKAYYFFKRGVDLLR